MISGMPLIALSQRVDVLADRGERRDALDQRRPEHAGQRDEACHERRCADRTGHQLQVVHDSGEPSRLKVLDGTGPLNHRLARVERLCGHVSRGT